MFHVTDVTHYHKYRISGGGGEREGRRRQEAKEREGKKVKKEGERETRRVEVREEE